MADRETAATTTAAGSKGGRGIGFWLLVAAGVAVLCCGGAGVAAWFGARDLVDIAMAPADERLKLIDAKLTEVGGERVHVASSFLAAVDGSRESEAWGLTAPSFQAATTREQFGDLVRLVPRVMGPLQSKLLTNLEAKSVVGGPSLCVLVYQGTFEKGAASVRVELEETPAGWRVRGWRTDSPLFAQAAARGAESGK